MVHYRPRRQAVPSRETGSVAPSRRPPAASAAWRRSGAPGAPALRNYLLTAVLVRPKVLTA
jgi:hypothetical protein